MGRRRSELAGEIAGCDKILVRGVNWIGDAVMTIPAIRAIRRVSPHAKISLLLNPTVAPLFEQAPDIDEIILYEKKFRSLAGRIRLANRLRSEKFCAAVLLQNAFDAALLSFMSGIPVRIGYDRDGRGLLLTDPIPFDKKAEALHHVDYYLNLLEAAGLSAPRTKPKLFVSADEALAARRTLGSLSRPVVGINPGAAFGSSKRWPPELFARTAEGIIKDQGGSVVIFGGSGEVGIAGEIADGIDSSVQKPDRVLNLSGRTSVRELSALISMCDVLVTNDSGPMHIGYAVGTPIVAIFGSTSPEHTGPLGPTDRVIIKKVDCSPCFKRKCDGKDLICMKRITPDEVLKEVGGLIHRKKAVFFDRDGTLCHDAHYLNRMEDFRIFDDISTLNRLKEKGYLLIGITNQSGIARGIVNENFVRTVNGIFMSDYGFDGFYYCPHHPDEHCSCRKPEPGLLHRAAVDFGIDLNSSFVVGDKDADMLLAVKSGAVGIHVATGQQEKSSHADFSVENLTRAVDVILENS